MPAQIPPAHFTSARAAPAQSSSGYIVMRIARALGMIVGFIAAVVILLPVALVLLVEMAMHGGRWLVREREG